MYVFLDDGPRRLPMGAVHNRAKPQHRYPQLSGKRVREVEAVYEFRGDRLFMAPLIGNYVIFDETGQLKVDEEALFATMEAVAAQDDLRKTTTENVPDLAKARSARKTIARRDAEHRWSLDEEQRRAITRDLLGSTRPHGAKAIPILRRAAP
jgi:hypothetical protein